MSNKVESLPKEIAYEEVSQSEFFDYLDKINEQLKEVAPEWEIKIHHAPCPDSVNIIFHEFTIYHLARVDFSKGIEQTWPVLISQSTFAYKKDDEYYLLNVYPIQEIKSDKE